MNRIKFLLVIILFLSPMSLLAESDNSSSEAGLFYSTWGNVDKAVVGINHIALLTAEPGFYNNCTMTITDYSNNQSQPLQISPFVVGSKS